MALIRVIALPFIGVNKEQHLNGSLELDSVSEHKGMTVLPFHRERFLLEIYITASKSQSLESSIIFIS